MSIRWSLCGTTERHLTHTRLTESWKRWILISGVFVTKTRVFASLVAAALSGTGVYGQSVVSTHSGLIYYFAGSVYLGDERLEQRFGRFPDIGQDRELRTELGRAEVLLTPGTLIRLDENTSIRMLSTVFSDTRVELLRGSAILETTETTPNTRATLIYKDWQIRVPRAGTYRIDTTPPRIRPYQGEVKVGVTGKNETITVREGESLPLAEVLLGEPATPGTDDFKVWAMNRSQAISADNKVSAGIVDDPGRTDGRDLASGGYTYFPSMGIPSLDVGTPYGLSFWSPFQNTLASLYFPAYLLYGPLYRTGPGGIWTGGNWLGGGIRPLPGHTILPTPIGARPPRTPPRITVPAPRPAPPPHAVPGPHH